MLDSNCMRATDTLTFELRNHRDSSEGANAMAQVLSALPSPVSGIRQLFSHTPTVTVEFFSQGQIVYTFLTVPATLGSYITGQLRAAYPKILITPLSHNPLHTLSTTLPEAVGSIRLQHTTYFPLKTVFADNSDPLANVLTPLTKLQPNESALIQTHLRKAKDNWKQKANNALATPTPPSAGTRY